jgi:tetratricopeptide (TPR) repeat protein
MKAEHRKELETNVLADRMGRIVQSVRSGERSRSVVAWVIAGIAVVVLLIWFYARGSGGSHGDAWVQLDENTNPDALQKIAADHPGTVVARVARFQRARLLLQSALGGLCPNNMAPPNMQTEERTKAIADMEEARSLYEGLATEVKDDPVLSQEANLGAGKAEEALVSIPKADDATQHRGDIGRAVSYYRKALDRLEPDSALAKALTQHVEVLEKDGKDVQDFYAQLNRIAETETKRIK